MGNILAVLLVVGVTSGCELSGNRDRVCVAGYRCEMMVIEVAEELGGSGGHNAYV